jgi:hypothetical protein
MAQIADLPSATAPAAATLRRDALAAFSIALGLGLLLV